MTSQLHCAIPLPQHFVPVKFWISIVETLRR